MALLLFALQKLLLPRSAAALATRASRGLVLTARENLPRGRASQSRSQLHRQPESQRDVNGCKTLRSRLRC
jgi:hypothetical protein